MNPEQINIAIAEHCGWRSFEFNPYTNQEFGIKPGESNPAYKYQIPNYYENLNAMHEAEKTLSDTPSWYTHNLLCIAVWTGKYPVGFSPSEEQIRWGLTHATASQRAEAFLRTIGKWEDE